MLLTGILTDFTPGIAGSLGIGRAEGRGPSRPHSSILQQTAVWRHCSVAKLHRGWKGQPGRGWVGFPSHHFNISFPYAILHPWCFLAVFLLCFV